MFYCNVYLFIFGLVTEYIPLFLFVMCYLSTRKILFFLPSLRNSDYYKLINLNE